MNLFLASWPAYFEEFLLKLCHHYYLPAANRVRSHYIRMTLYYVHTHSGMWQLTLWLHLPTQHHSNITTQSYTAQWKLWLNLTHLKGRLVHSRRLYWHTVNSWSRLCCHSHPQSSYAALMHTDRGKPVESWQFGNRPIQQSTFTSAVRPHTASAVLLRSAVCESARLQAHSSKQHSAQVLLVLWQPRGPDMQPSVKQETRLASLMLMCNYSLRHYNCTLLCKMEYVITSLNIVHTRQDLW